MSANEGENMITDRQLSILNAIVEDYVDFGQPVGSKTLIERHSEMLVLLQLEMR